MIRNRFLLKSVSVFLILETVFNIVAPTISWALTSGPTAPEATSFEPVDTTDMVNLLTGDLAYNIPVIEVPGPSGSYPLSLSYHAGIQPNIDASWVGLGFSLNAGSISRLVNGYADDHKEVEVKDHFYWDGHERSTYSIGISVPMSRGGSVTAGLSFTQDSQYGFSVNPYMAGQMEIAAGVGIQANSVTGAAQITAPGLNYMNMIESKEFTAGPFSISKKGVGIKTGFGPLSLDVSINSKQVKPKLSIGSGSKGVSREGKVNRENSNWNVTVPTPWGFGVSLGRSYVRQWIDENASVNVNGTLYFPQTKPDYTYLNQRAFDVYDLLYEDQGKANKDPERELGGSFVNYDDYTVNAQGLSGSIRPYHYYEFLYRQNRNNDDKAVLRSVPMGVTANRVGFRFVNDFSNKFLFEPPVPKHTSPGMSMTFPAEGIAAGLDGEGYKDNILAGSKHIEYFTNNQIVNERSVTNGKGFIDCNAIDFTRSASATEKLGDQIGSFKVTNESGVTYHFSLPVYSYEEYTYTEKIKPAGGSKTYSEVTKNTKYAYTWMLTAVTGPDYVDRGGANGTPNGVVDEGDYGYWVEFGYSKWRGDYIWRNPASDFNREIDHNFKTYSSGKKEIYYLDFIRTSSHIALFEKSERLDGKGVASKSGGFSNASASTLKLDKIYLLDNKDFNAIGGMEIRKNIQGYKSSIIEKSIRAIEFSYDYALVPGTDNSFASNTPLAKNGKLTLENIKFLGHQGADMLPKIKFSYEVENPASETVTLNRVGSDNKQFSFISGTVDLEEGDIVSFQYSGKTFYAVVWNVNSESKSYQMRIIEGGDSSILNGQQVTYTETKNPPYNKDKFDMWGLYKSDFEKGLRGDSRQTTTLSSKAVDVWSLRGISTITGSYIKLDYEPDYYDEVVLNFNSNPYANSTQQALRIKNAQRLSANELKVFFFNDGYDLTESFSINEKVDMMLIGAYRNEDLTKRSGPASGCACPSIGYAYHKGFDRYSSTVSGVNAVEYSITVTIDNSSGLMTALSSNRLTTIDYNSNCGAGGEPASCTYDVANNWPSFIAGGLAFTSNKPKYAGGIRVKEVSISNLSGAHHIKYTYNNGVTSYEPAFVPPFEMNPDYYGNLPTDQRAMAYEQASALLTDATLNRYSNLLNIAREVPAPGVMYKSVEVRGAVENGSEEYIDPTYKRYEFQTFSRDMVKYNQKQMAAGGGSGSGFDQNPNPLYASGLQYTYANTAEVTLDDLTTAIGNLKFMATYDNTGNLIESSKFTYLHDDYLNTLADEGYKNYANTLNNKFKSQGLIKESFADARVAKSYSNSNYILLGITSKRRTYPSVMTKQVYKNYKTGIETTNETTGFDFFSGDENESVTTDGYGNVFVSRSEAAYKKYPAMGLGMYGRKNMLSQIASSVSYKVNPADHNDELSLVSASVQTWTDQVPYLNPDDLYQGNKQVNIWRKHASYSFVGDDNTSVHPDGFYLADKVTAFTAWNIGDAIPAGWQKNAEVTLYDVQSHTLEAIDMNGDYVATRMTSDQIKVLTTATNARYNEFAYSGAEDFNTKGYSGNLVYKNDGSISNLFAHTGTYSLAVAPNKSGFHSSVRIQNKNYNRKIHVSFWVHKSNAKQIELSYMFVAGFGTSVEPELISLDLTKARRAGDWLLCETDIPVDPKTISTRNNLVTDIVNAGTSTIYIDDFRVHPVDAAVTSYVYNKWGELSHILDNNNLYTEYRYDGVGRLQSTFKESFQVAYGNQGIAKISDVNYNYGSNNPYIFTINASGSGTRGYVYPSGNVSVEQGKDLRFEMRDKCQYNSLAKVLIDGKQIDLDKSSLTLLDGTVVSIQSSGKIITFSKVQSAHTLRAQFTSNSVAGIVECRGTIDGNGNTCYDGGYRYAYYNVCGKLENWVEISRKAQIPADLIEQAINNCCTMNTSGTDNTRASSCFCKPGSTTTTNSGNSTTNPKIVQEP